MSDDKRTERIMFTATTETKEFLKEWAGKEGRTISNLVERIVLDAIADKQKEDKWRKHNDIWHLKRSLSCKYTWHCRCVSLRKIFPNDTERDQRWALDLIGDGRVRSWLPRCFRSLLDSNVVCEKTKCHLAEKIDLNDKGGIDWMNKKETERPLYLSAFWNFGEIQASAG